MDEPSMEGEARIEGAPSIGEVCSAYIIGANGRYKPNMAESMLRSGPSFNVFAFLFGPLYYFYRKQYRVGVAYLAFNILYSLAMDALFPPRMDPAHLMSFGQGLGFFALEYLLPLLVGVAMGFAFYPLYRRSAERALREWERRGNPGENPLWLIKKRGGTSNLAWVAALLLVLGIALIQQALGLA